MPVVTSKIESKKIQANGQIKVHEKHIDSMGYSHRFFYVAPGDADTDTRLTARVGHVNQALKDQEIKKYLSDIEAGINIVGLEYIETNQAERAQAFFEWAKQKIEEKDFQALRYTPSIIDRFSEVAIDTMIGDGEGIKVKAWTEKIKAMNTATAGIEV